MSDHALATLKNGTIVVFDHHYFVSYGNGDNTGMMIPENTVGLVLANKTHDGRYRVFVNSVKVLVDRWALVTA